jgi:regulator of sirC expression with transglutaminase-like and TPR domain
MLFKSGTRGSDRRRHLIAPGRGASDLPPAEAALRLAALDRPGVVIAPYLRRIETMAAGLGDRLGSSPSLARQAEALARCAEGVEDEEAGDLITLLDHGHGMAGARALLAVALGRGAGLRVEVPAFPDLWLLRLSDADGGQWIIDPLAGPQPLDPPVLRALLKAVGGLDAELTPAHCAGLDDRALVLRHGAELKSDHLRRGRLDSALALVEGMLRLAPDEDFLWREAGMMHLRLDHHPAALAALEHFLARTRNDGQRARTQALVSELRCRLPSL